MKSNRNTPKFCFVIFLSLLIFTGCKKYLDEKSNKSYAVPQSVSDLQALLDYYPTMNTRDPSCAEISTNDYFISDDDYAALPTDQYRSMYTWQPDNLFAPQFNDWGNSYKAVYIANTVLDNLGSIAKDDPGAWNNVKGQALVFRAKNFLQIASIWAMAYNPASAGTDLGIPLRLNSDFNIKSVRANLGDTYSTIIRDLELAVPLLPVTPVTPLRPCRGAAYGLLARTYLEMGNYSEASLYADSCLQLSNKLLDFKTLAASDMYPISRFNQEVIFESFFSSSGPVSTTIAMIDTDLYNSYAPNDLRKLVYFSDANNGYYTFKGSYEGGTSLFSGLATDEMYLTRAEANAELGNLSLAMKDLNTLLKNRYDNSFTALTAANAAAAIALIRQERRKEMLMRGIRWADIKRLNVEGAGIILNRKINGQGYVLQPNDPRWALPIPDDVITLTGMPQNPR